MQKKIVLIVFLVSLLFGVYSQLSAEESSVPWRDDQMNALFPAPLPGWTAGDVNVHKSDSTSADLDSFLDTNAGIDIKAGSGYTFTRQYQMESLWLEIKIDTLDPENHWRITRTHDDQHAKITGLVATTVGGRSAVSIKNKSGQAVLIKISSAGTVGIKCADGNCVDAIERYLNLLNLNHISDFVESVQLLKD